ncbi:MAG: hypothetical protein K2H01_01565 [Ruminococcus sp.]|nr:hypothetical protein [Ruminococcus sp.]
MAKSVSYIARNERKYVDRRIKTLRADMKTMSNREKNATKSYIKQLQTLKKQTYIKQRTPEARAKALEATLKLRNIGRISKNTADARQNKIIQRELNVASRGVKSTFLGSAYKSQAYTKIFYQATRNIWQGYPAHVRNELIMAALGTKSLKKAVVSVLSVNREAIALALGRSNTGSVHFPAYLRIHEKQVSPDYLDAVNTVDDKDDIKQVGNNNVLQDEQNIFSIETMKKELVDVAKDAWDSSDGSIEDFLSTFEDNASSMLENYGEKFEDIFNSIKEGIENIGSTVGEGLEDVGEGAETIGEDVEAFVESDGFKEIIETILMAI